MIQNCDLLLVAISFSRGQSEEGNYRILLTSSSGHCVITSFQGTDSVVPHGGTQESLPPSKYTRFSLFSLPGLEELI